MATTAQQVLAIKAHRNAARAQLDTQLAAVRQDVEARGIGGRIVDRVTADAMDVFEGAVEVAEDNKGVVAGTIAALAFWFFRSPIGSFVEQVLNHGADDEHAFEEEYGDER